MNKMLRRILAITCTVLLTVSLSACSSSSSTTSESGSSKPSGTNSSEVTTKKPLSEMTHDELVAAAKEEGNYFETVGMPDDWANWGGSWAALKEKYGIEHADTDMTSAEELALRSRKGRRNT